MVLGTSPCTVLFTHRKCSSYTARPVMCSRATAASWWNTRNTGGAGRLPDGGWAGSGLPPVRVLGSQCSKILSLPKPTCIPELKFPPLLLWGFSGEAKSFLGPRACSISDFP